MEDGTIDWIGIGGQFRAHGASLRLMVLMESLLCYESERLFHFPKFYCDVVPIDWLNDYVLRSYSMKIYINLIFDQPWPDSMTAVILWGSFTIITYKCTMFDGRGGIQRRVAKDGVKDGVVLILPVIPIMTYLQIPFYFSCN